MYGRTNKQTNGMMYWNQIPLKRPLEEERPEWAQFNETPFVLEVEEMRPYRNSSSRTIERTSKKAYFLIIDY